MILNEGGENVNGTTMASQPINISIPSSVFKAAQKLAISQGNSQNLRVSFFLHKSSNLFPSDEPVDVVRAYWELVYFYCSRFSDISLLFLQHSILTCCDNQFQVVAVSVGNNLILVNLENDIVIEHKDIMEKPGKRNTSEPLVVWFTFPLCHI